MFTRIVAIIFVANFGILVAGGSVIKPKPGIRFLEPILKCYGDGKNGNMGRHQSDDEIIKMVCQDMKVGTAVTNHLRWVPSLCFKARLCAKLLI